MQPIVYPKRSLTSFLVNIPRFPKETTAVNKIVSKPFVDRRYEDPRYLLNDNGLPDITPYEYYLQLAYEENVKNNVGSISRVAQKLKYCDLSTQHNILHTSYKDQYGNIRNGILFVFKDRTNFPEPYKLGEYENAMFPDPLQLDADMVIISAGDQSDAMYRYGYYIMVDGIMKKLNMDGTITVYISVDEYYTPEKNEFIKYGIPRWAKR